MIHSGANPYPISGGQNPEVAGGVYHETREEKRKHMREGEGQRVPRVVVEYARQPGEKSLAALLAWASAAAHVKFDRSNSERKLGKSSSTPRTRSRSINAILISRDDAKNLLRIFRVANRSQSSPSVIGDLRGSVKRKRQTRGPALNTYVTTTLLRSGVTVRKISDGPTIREFEYRADPTTHDGKFLEMGTSAG